MVMMYYQASTFEIVFGLVIEITVLVVAILLLRVMFRKIVKSEADFKTKETPLGIKISAALQILLSVPFILLGGFSMLFGFFFSFYYGILGTVVFSFAIIPTFLGFLIIFIGVSFWKLNYIAWKGSIIIFITIVILFITFSSFFGVLFIMDLASLGSSVSLIIIIVSIGNLIYIFKVKDLFLSKIEDRREKDEEEVSTTVQVGVDEISRKCSSCGKLNEPNTEFCPFCGSTSSVNE
ncbi:MAG: zinc ribbon domain-containing protein [Candidatus Hodarchaeales archaeon]